jgi:hypothetical protein
MRALVNDDVEHDIGKAGEEVAVGNGAILD